MTSRPPRRWPTAAALVLTGALLATPWAAQAATQDKTGTSDVTVAVPSATPTSAPAPTFPPQVPPVANPNGGGAPGAGGGTTAPGGSKTSGGAGGAGAGAGTAAPAGDAAATTAACVPKEPAVPTTPATTGGEATVGKPVYLAGETVTAVAGGFGANEQVQLVFFTEPALVGTFAADAAGSVTAQFAVSNETLAGTHVAQFTGWCGTIALADVLVGAASSAADAGQQQGVPTWAWWVGGGLGALLLVAGAWWAIRTMRAPGAEVVPA